MRLIQKAEMSSDDRGYFRWFGGRQIRYGKDKCKATVANAKIGELWQRVTAEGGTWDETTWQIAYALRDGRKQVFIQPNPQMVGNESYVHWVDRLALAYGDLIEVLPAIPQNYEAGAGEMVEIRQAEMRHVEIAYPTPLRRTNASETLHKVLDAYIADLQATQEDETGAGMVRVRRAQFLREHFEDMPLAKMTIAEMEKMLAYLAKRPRRKKDGQPISAGTAKAEIVQLRHFWKWLNRRKEEFGWTKPEDLNEVRTRVVSFAADKAKLLKAVHIDTYSPEELAKLYKEASLMLRLFILLGLNCGFSHAEFCSLTLGEIKWEKWKIERARHKNEVYGEWQLWPETLAGLRWAKDRKERLGSQAPQLLVNDQGEPLRTKTDSSNNSRLTYLWKRLLDRMEPGFKKLPPKQLRKIGADMVRQVSNGEIAAIYLAHGSPVKGDPIAHSYSNKPFPELHKATEQVRARLQLMFDAVPCPFPA